jgi:hypothetical protein
MPPHFNAVILPQYDGETDLREFLPKYEAVVESNGGGSAIKAKALIMAVNGSAQHWFASIPKGHIYSWSQLRSKLLTSFRGLKAEELTSGDFHDCKQGEKETLHEYMQRIIKMQAKALNVADLTVIEAATSGLRVGSCQDYLGRCKPSSMGELFDIMQEYCKLDHGRRSKIEVLKQEKKTRTNQWSQLKPWHADQVKQQS